ncbi:GNAT family N-acetyltransferase [Chroococcidiopsis sp. CCALA 051]|uniref:GNAT family N-acetyltransferase n=1 Tax=Chroococcidiopsis sp. CCALA 051 TaxID=869949 RepID=UPI001E40BD10|nr:GNAT family N-acetyltransferase [Chroococcidiopsis sp. CCALA 051]
MWKQVLQKLHHDVYHLPEYIEIESKRTSTLPNAFIIIDDEKIFFVPYLLRQCDDILDREISRKEVFDIVSPYGYPGILLSKAAINTPGFPDFAIRELRRVLFEHKVCSAFFRLHPILNFNFNEVFQPNTFTTIGETVSVDLTLSESKIWAHTRKGHQSTINKCKRLGFTGKMVNFKQYIHNFISIYNETMERVGAQKSYYFSHEYFEDLLKLGQHLHLGIVELDNEIACASLFLESSGIVQAHLGGTKNQFLRYSPFNLLVDYARNWAKARGNKFLHLGGGVGCSTTDSLYTFKSGFSRTRHPFLTLRLIIDEEKYHYLVNSRAKLLNVRVEELLSSRFFPAYRCFR